jgi:hypothetical protein
MTACRFRALARLCVCVSGFLAVAVPSRAQEEPSRVGPFVVDVRGVIPRFNDNADVALSRGLYQAEMPGVGLGVSAGAHVYLPKRFGFTVGLGGEALIGRSHADSSALITDPITGVQQPARAVTETLKSFAPQISLNFKGPSGWSYLSVGIGRSIWSIVPDGGTPRPVDEEAIRTIDYGGGARWFITPRLGFTLDVRFYEIDNGSATAAFPGSPRAVLLVIGAGVSIR